jgi:hypothetical protein
MVQHKMKTIQSVWHLHNRPEYHRRLELFRQDSFSSWYEVPYTKYFHLYELIKIIVKHISLLYLKKVLLQAIISFQLTKIVSTSSNLTTPDSTIGFWNT